MTGFGLICAAYILAEVYGAVHGYESNGWMSWHKKEDHNETCRSD